MGQTGSAELDLILGGCCLDPRHSSDTEQVIDHLASRARHGGGEHDDDVKVLSHMILSDASRSGVPVGLSPLKSGGGTGSGFVETLDADELEEFTICIERPADKGFGFSFHSSDGQMLIVTDIMSGSLMDEWNKTCLTHQQIKKFDCLYQINGRIGFSQELVARLKDFGNFELVFKRPKEFVVSVSKQGKVLGLLLSPTSGAGLFVQDVQAGAVQDARLNVRPSDHIVAVNGRDTDAVEMMEQIKHNDQLTLKVLSYR
eukprot:TRINITY_DN31621_c0_g2_i1.p1 TRINITY_DN31621_c0_g2~~TRINITY_DN31621_c0_g2_i1.p1  ORF type:complete len:267 (-),score=53.61 TRINITY_DN31621_c0_g2_i1:146-919(-)